MEENGAKDLPASHEARKTVALTRSKIEAKRTTATPRREPLGVAISSAHRDGVLEVDVAPNGRTVSLVIPITAPVRPIKPRSGDSDRRPLEHLCVLYATPTFQPLRVWRKNKRYNPA